MSEYKMDRLLWMPREEWCSEYQEALTRVVTPYVGEPYEVRCWEEDGEWVGVPRVFGKLVPPWWASSVPEPEKIPAPPVTISWRRGQKPAVEKMLTAFASGVSGVRLEAPPASGKTLMALAVAFDREAPTLVVVHKTDLAKQWQDTARKFFGEEAGHVQGSKWDWKGRRFTTALAQTLYSRRDKLPEGFREAFGLVVYDEGHHYPSESFSTVLSMFPARRLAVSATWRRADGLADLWEWHVGRTVVVAETERLTGEFVHVPWRTPFNDMWYTHGGRVNRARLLTLIEKNEAFSTWLAEQCIKGVNAGRRVLLVSDRIAQLAAIHGRAVERGHLPGLYCRSFPQKGEKKRRRITEAELAAAREHQIILATYTLMMEGTDVPALDTLIFGTPRADVEQVVGRIQRPSAEKKSLLVVDPVFQTRYCRALAGKREEQLLNLGFTKRVKR